MGRLDRPSLLRWPRRIMASIVSLRNRLATALSPSSPVRSRYSQALWKESSSNWESEIVMAGKRSQAAGSPIADEANAQFAGLAEPYTRQALRAGQGWKARGRRSWNSIYAKLLQSGKRE
jgi:hypothetical protein